MSINKCRPLDTALRESIFAGMTLHLTTQCRAATRAIQRLFQGEPLQLKLVMGRIGGGHGADLLESGLVSAGSFGAATRGHTGPLNQVQRVYASGAVSFQHWSFYSLTQRLAAGAQGLPFLPTHSLVGSTMAADNYPDFQVIDDPIGSGRKVGVLRALNPDVSVIHALAADEEGNTILVPPIEDAAWGAKACTAGAIVTVEKVVSRDFIRRHSHLVRIPGRYVRAVCEVPFGAHPGSLYSPVLEEIGGYVEDEAFNAAYFAAARDVETLRCWLQKWVHEPVGHQAYLTLLGNERLRALGATVRGVLPPASITEDQPVALSPPEKMMVMATREVLRAIDKQPSPLLLVGVGLSEVPGTAAKLLLALQGVEVKLAMGHGFYDFEPFPGYSEPDLTRTQMTTDSTEMYGTILGGRPGSTLALLGAAQVDLNGNLNSTVVGGRLLTGSGGSNDAASTCDTLVVIRLGKRKLVEQVEYITCPGTRVSVVVTEKGVFRKLPGTSVLRLCEYFPEDGKSATDIVEEIAAGCGWQLQVAPGLTACEPPSALELATIRSLMPARYG